MKILAQTNSKSRNAKLVEEIASSQDQSRSRYGNCQIYLVLCFVAVFLKTEKRYKNVLTITVCYYIINLASRLEQVKKP
jgi:hypothetical protein